MKTTKTKLFWILVITQALIALTLFYYNKNPINNYYPVGHRFSIPVLVLYVGTMASCRLLWLWNVNGKRATSLPSPAVVLMLAALATILSAVFFHPLSMLGWCCENARAFFFGFPFSYLIGLGSSLASLRLPHAENVLKILFLSTSQPQNGWQFLPQLFFLDFLFWSNTILVFLSLINWFRQRETLPEPTKDKMQSKTI